MAGCPDLQDIRKVAIDELLDPTSLCVSVSLC
jgi:hypothetical protein